MQDQSGREVAALHELQHAVDDWEGTHPRTVPELFDAEARAHSTDKRRKMTPEERKAQPPWLAIERTRRNLKSDTR